MGEAFALSSCKERHIEEFDDNEEERNGIYDLALLKATENYPPMAQKL